MKTLKMGGPVIYVDHRGVERDALVTQIWGPVDDLENNPPSINLVYVSGDEDKDDSWGRQIDRDSSVVHEKHQGAHGNKWRLAE